MNRVRILSLRPGCNVSPMNAVVVYIIKQILLNRVSQNNCEIPPTFTLLFTKLLPWQDRCAALPRSWEKSRSFLDWQDEWNFIKKSKRKLILHIPVHVILYYEEFQL